MRARTLEVLDAHPGIHKRGLRERVGVHPQDLEHHVDVLVEAGEVVTFAGARGNETVCFLRRHEHLWADEDTRVLWGRPETRRVAALVVANPDRGSKGLAALAGLTRDGVLHHLRRMRANGLVERVQVRRHVSYKATRKLEVWMDEHGPGRK